MTAQEQFEKLGFRLTEESNDDWKNFKKGDFEIDFDLEEKNYQCSEEGCMTWKSMTVGIGLHQAITKQMIELGWIPNDE